MRPPRPRALPAWALAALLALPLAPGERPAGAAARAAARALPSIVFASRLPPGGAQAGQVPGLGPHGTFAGSGGRLLERSPDGRVRELLPAGRLFDVADPDVSADGREVAFAARETRDSPWRIWAVSRAQEDPVRPGAPVAGLEPRCLTCDDGAPSKTEASRSHDADPAWWGEALLFASTRAGGRSLYDGSPVTQLWARLPDGRRAQLTHEPNGALDPVVDGATGRVVFARWWFNPWRVEPPGVATRVGARGDSVNLWHVVSARLARGGGGSLVLEDLRLEAGGTPPRRGGMGLQPTPRTARGLLAVAARNPGLAPRPGPLAILRFAPPPARGVRVAGAAIGEDAEDPYREGSNLAAPAACAPAMLADGRTLFALDPGGRGEFGLCVLSADGEAHAMLVDEPGRWELDAAPVPEPASSRVRPGAGAPAGAARESLTARPGGTSPPIPTFRYLSRDVFAGRGAPARRGDAMLHVFRARDADSVEFLRRAAVPRSGRVDLALPADTPLFEVLTDPAGQPLANAHGVAQVRGSNSGAPGTTSRCAGCHLGHSARP